MKLTVFIPAYNEAKTIGSVIDRIPKKINQIDQIEVVVVDDGSIDQTSQIAEAKNCHVIKHPKNLGLGQSFKDGLEKAMQMKSDILVTIDADNQFTPEEIEKIIQPIIEKHADFVTGSRFIDPSYTPKNMPKIKKWGNRQIAKIISISTGAKFHDVSCGFRAYSKEAMLRLNLFGKFTYTQETFLDLAHKGLQISEIPVTVKYFEDRTSRIAQSLTRYGFKAGEIIIRTIKDYSPLKFFGLCGLFIFLFGLGLDIFVIGHYLATGTFSPYKVFGFTGAFLNAIGIMVMFIGILADQIDKIRINQENMLYFEKRRKYYDQP